MGPRLVASSAFDFRLFRRDWRTNGRARQPRRGGDASGAAGALCQITGAGAGTNRAGARGQSGTSIAQRGWSSIPRLQLAPARLGIVRFASRFPHTFYVMAAAMLFLGVGAVLTAPRDIFPRINIPVVTVIWQYTGLTPDQMEQRVTTYSEYSISPSRSPGTSRRRCSRTRNGRQ